MNLRRVSKGTWVRMITLLLVLANLISTSIFDFVLVPFGEEVLSEGASIILTVVVTLWTTWKNNSFTKKAQEADEYLKNLRNWG